VWEIVQLTTCEFAYQSAFQRELRLRFVERYDPKGEPLRFNRAKASGTYFFGQGGAVRKLSDGFVQVHVGRSVARHCSSD
jgi:hypothetical protein